MDPAYHAAGAAIRCDQTREGCLGLAMPMTARRGRSGLVFEFSFTEPLRRIRADRTRMDSLPATTLAPLTIERLAPWRCDPADPMSVHMSPSRTLLIASNESSQCVLLGPIRPSHHPANQPGVGIERGQVSAEGRAGRSHPMQPTPRRRRRPTGTPSGPPDRVNEGRGSPHRIRVTADRPGFRRRRAPSAQQAAPLWRRSA